MNFIFSFSRNANFPEFQFYQKENLRSFFHLANYSVYRASLLGNVYLYTTEQEVDLFRKNIFTAPVVYRVIPDNRTFFWARSKFLSLLDFIQEFNKECLHVDLDLFFIKKFIKHEPGLIISHGEPYSDAGLEYLKSKNIPEACFQGWYHQVHERAVGMREWGEILSMGYAFNTSIFGGYDTGLVADICKKILSFVDRYDAPVLSLIQKDRSAALLFTGVAEQAYLAYICKCNGMVPEAYGWPGNYLHFYSHTKLDACFRSKMERLIEQRLYCTASPDEYFYAQV